MLDSTEELVQQGKQLLATNNLDGAAEVFRQAVALSPTNAEAHFCLGVALLEQGLIEQALQAFEQSTRHETDFAAAWHNLGYCYYRLGYIDNAVAALQRAVSAQPDKGESHLLLGLCYIQLAKLAPAVESLETALRYSGESIPREEVYKMLSDAYDILEEHEKSNYYANLCLGQQESSQVSRSLRVEHFICFSRYEDALQAAKAYLAEGFEAQLLSEPHDGDDTFCVMVIDNTPVESEMFEQVISQMEQIASQFGGEYDGWGHEV